MSRILREPLLHFLVLGTVMFTAYGWINVSGNEATSGEIRISQGQVASMVESFTRTWQRPPSQEELAGLVRDRVREEVYVREAIALNLDKDDAVIRSHLRQKMEFVTNDVVAQAEPTDEELSAFLKTHPDRFRTPQHLTFSQVFLDRARHGEAFPHDALQLLATLNGVGGDADVGAFGDPLRLIEHTFVGARSDEIANQFGKEFADGLVELEPGRWLGPVKSGYGVHLVFIKERSKGDLPALADVRDAVRVEWTNARRAEANETFFAEALERYAITIADMPIAAKNLASK